MVNGQVARFGRKATDVTLLGFNAGAFQNEMGITSSVAPSEQLLVGVSFPFAAAVSPTTGPELSDQDLALVRGQGRATRFSGTSGKTSPARAT